MSDRRLKPEDRPTTETPDVRPIREMPEPTLGVVVASLAKRPTDGQLALLSGAAIAGIFAILLFVPEWWRVSLPLVSIAAFGGWAIAERERGRNPSRDAVLKAVQSLAAVVGVAAFFAVGLMLLSVALGTWIS